MSYILSFIPVSPPPPPPPSALLPLLTRQVQYIIDDDSAPGPGEEKLPAMTAENRYVRPVHLPLGVVTLSTMSLHNMLLSLVCLVLECASWMACSGSHKLLMFVTPTQCTSECTSLTCSLETDVHIQYSRKCLQHTPHVSYVV